MALPQQPANPRVVYPDGSSIPIHKLWYGAQIHDTHVWVAEDPQFVPWVQGAHTEYDNPDALEPHYIVVGYDMTREDLQVKETFTLYSSDGQQIRDVSIDFFRPRMDVLTVGKRTWVWREEHQQYREASAYVVPLVPADPDR